MNVSPQHSPLEPVDAPPVVFLDANVYKFSSTRLPRMQPVRRPHHDERGEVTGYTLIDFVEVNPNDNITNPKLRHEAQLLEEIAGLAQAGDLEAVATIEVLGERMHLPKMDSRGGKFFGAPVRNIPTPIPYPRRLTLSPEEQAQLLASFKHPRFEALCRATGANQRESRSWRNMLLDAFHLWCAEHNSCDYFLTLDMKLIRSMHNSTLSAAKPELVLPSDLLAALR